MWVTSMADVREWTCTLEQLANVLVVYSVCDYRGLPHSNRDKYVTVQYDKKYLLFYE